MGQFSVIISATPGSILGATQHTRRMMNAAMADAFGATSKG